MLKKTSHWGATLLTLVMGMVFMASCNVVAQSKHESETTEGSGHDSDGAGHDKKETKGHDSDEKPHENSVARGEHAREKGGHKEGEEEGIELGLADTYDKTRHGVRLILSYDEKSNYFKGSMKNTTATAVQRARVEVHLSNGIELGPTTPVSIEAGKTHKVELKASEASFSFWSTHVEVGSSEEGHGESGEEHGREGRGESGEHKGEHRGD